ncbi:Retrovirus-related Pol polyprotein from transposon TNT 1-94 Includes: RecName: Full=Protease [Rhizoctonia solani AG-1 IB]|uniref:Rhizoctonia solani AG1-IB WGS project CAOJ00000000 data, isolate 7/3/14, contig 19141 n=1 Tax=Thanatephorus cucumeris (strain AG1-IB / isolate 7/3/14) TaxID=1108050 RepID=M5C592_THACB|nr:Retrovirus-related Pol polyprotein from transposon TNT 1-94 Includes: RecName: Full=Protease [Rhizoctonia solani AG-1 IB]
MSNHNPYMSRHCFEIEDLKEDGSNYVAWKTRSMQILRTRKLDSVVTGTNPKPSPGAAANEAKDWETRDQEALLQIMLSVSDGALKHIGHHTSAKSAWDALQHRWEGHGVQSLVFLVEKLFSDKAPEGKPLADFTAKQRSIATNVHNLGLELPEPLLALILLHSLPPSYDTLCTVIAGSTTLEKLTFDLVEAQILAEEQRSTSGSRLNAMFSKKVNGGKGKNGKGKSNRPTCKNCAKPGHTKEQCWAKGGDKEGQNPWSKKNDAKTNSPVSSTPATSTSSSQARLAHVENPPSDSNGWIHDGLGEVHAFMAHGAHSNSGSNAWVMDSGASAHMTQCLENFETYRAYNPPIAVEIANNSRIEVLGSGRVRIDLQTGHQAVLSNVLHVPALGSNLLSVSALQKAGKSVVFGGPGICRIMSREGGVIGEAKLVRGLYILQGCTVIPNPQALIAAVARADLSTWHRCLGHTNLDYILSMEHENRVEGMEIIGKRTKPDGRCQPCLRGKQSRTPFPKSSTERNYQPLELIVSDVHGPMAVPTHNGRQYFAPFIDIKTRYLWVAVVTRKSDVCEQFKLIQARVELQTGFKIKALRTDGGGEYASNKFETELRQAGIEHQKTEADSSASNGISEKAIRYLNEMERTIRDEAELPPQFWGYAILHSVEIWNVTAKKALGGMTPHEALFGTKPNIARLCVFGCKAFARILDKDRQKLGARSLECTYLGAAPGRKAHLLVDRKNRRFFTSRDVVFDEGGISRQRVVIEDSEKPEDKAIVSAEPNEPKVEPKVEKTHVPEPIKPKPQVKPEKGDSKRETSESEAENLIMLYAEPEKPAGRPKRNVRAPVRDNDDRYFVSLYEPSTFNRSKLPGTKGKISRPKTTENTPKNLLNNPDDPALAPFHAKLANLLVEPNSYKEAMA